jgi:hypothetical protein
MTLVTRRPKFLRSKVRYHLRAMVYRCARIRQIERERLQRAVVDVVALKPIGSSQGIAKAARTTEIGRKADIVTSVD